MASLVLKDAFVQVNAVNLSTFVRSVTLNIEAEAVEDTAMGLNTRRRIPGLKNWNVDVEFNADFAGAAVDATLFSLIGAAAFNIEVRPTSAVRSATNPGYNGNALLPSYVPMSGSVGDRAGARANFLAAGDLARATA